MRASCVAAWKRDEGQALIEYSLILALVAAGLVAVLLLFRDSLGNSYRQAGNHVDAARLPVSSPGGGTDGGTPSGAKGDHGCGEGQGGGLGRGGGEGCAGGRDR